MKSGYLRKNGNITIILLGLISVMLVLVMGLSRRMSGHTQLLTLSDYTQITRYFLESYAGDVLQQINVEVNKPGSTIYEAFRGAPGRNAISTRFYKPSSMLTALADELKIQMKTPPEIVFSKSEELPYPQGFDCPNNLKGKEKKGLLEIVCKAKFQGRDYTLRVQYPFTVVLKLVPILKDFALIADKIALEQGEEQIGPDDNINILFTKDGKHPEEIDSGLISHNKLRAGFKYRPFVLLPPLDMKEYTDANLTGRVFLGPSNRSIFLNLAGDTREVANDPNAAAEEINASVGEMFLVSPETFKVADNSTEYGYIPVFMNKSGQFIRMMGLNVPLKYDHTAKMGLLGFSYEVIPTNSDGIFSGSAYTAADFFNSGGKASEFWRRIENSNGYMAMASGLKLMGPRPDNPALGHTNRQIFGNVLSRFFVLTFWWPPSGGGEPLQFDEQKSPGNYPEREVYGSVKYQFEPKESGQKYQDFMSRMVSGNKWTPTGSVENLPDGFMAYNSDVSKKTKRIFTNIDFVANDGFLAKDRIENLTKGWFEIDTSRNRDKLGKGAEIRTGRSFASGEEFLAAAGVDKGFFNVNGVVYVKGPLKVPALTMGNDKIGGGVVLVDGPIELEKITRGYNIDTNQFKLGRYGNMLFSGPAYDFYQKWKTEITQENFLTFVSLQGDPITVKGEALIGVHLINVYDRENRPYGQIKWSTGSSKEIVFCGAMSTNYLDLPERMREFGYIRSSCNLLRAPFFMYHSAMAAKDPATAVQMMENMRGYMLTAARAEND